MATASASKSKRFTLYIHDPITRKQFTLALGITKSQLEMYLNTMNREFAPVAVEEGNEDGERIINNDSNE